MAPLGAPALAVALDLALQRGKRLLEREAGVGGHGVGVELRAMRDVDRQRAADVDPALRAVLVAELNTNPGGRDLQSLQRTRHLARNQRTERTIFAESLDHD
jgi:hypothetical protein